MLYGETIDSILFEMLDALRGVYRLRDMSWANGGVRIVKNCGQAHDSPNPHAESVESMRIRNTFLTTDLVSRKSVQRDIHSFCQWTFYALELWKLKSMVLNLMVFRLVWSQTTLISFPITSRLTALRRGKKKAGWKADKFGHLGGWGVGWGWRGGGHGGPRCQPSISLTRPDRESCARHPYFGRYPSDIFWGLILIRWGSLWDLVNACRVVKWSSTSYIHIFCSSVNLTHI